LQQQPVVIAQQQCRQQQRGQHALSRTGLVSAQWLPPSSGRYKCNVDAAFSKRIQRTGLGICIRDESGTFVLAKVLQFAQIYSVPIGEALGLYHAIQWLQDMRFDNINFELDSKITRDVFHSRTVDVTKFGTIIGACQHLFSSSFTNSRVEFIQKLSEYDGSCLSKRSHFFS